MFVLSSSSSSSSSGFHVMHVPSAPSETVLVFSAALHCESRFIAMSNQITTNFKLNPNRITCIQIKSSSSQIKLSSDSNAIQIILIAIRICPPLTGSNNKNDFCLWHTQTTPHMYWVKLRIQKRPKVSMWSSYMLHYSKITKLSFSKLKRDQQQTVKQSAVSFGDTKAKTMKSNHLKH